jgi:hypothetical protein
MLRLECGAQRSVKTLYLVFTNLNFDARPAIRHHRFCYHLTLYDFIFPLVSDSTITRRSSHDYSSLELSDELLVLWNLRRFAYPNHQKRGRSRNVLSLYCYYETSRPRMFKTRSQTTGQAPLPHDYMYKNDSSEEKEGHQSTRCPL